MGKDNEVTEMVPMIVHMWRYMISKERKKKWGHNQHACNVQDDLSVTGNAHDTPPNSPHPCSPLQSVP